MSESSDANIATAVAAQHARAVREQERAMGDKATISTPQWEAISVSLAVSERALEEVRADKPRLDALEKQNAALEKQNHELRDELKRAVAACGTTWPAT